MQAGATLKAAGLVVVAMTVIGLIDTYVDVIAAEAGLAQFHALRAAIALPLIWFAARLSGADLRPKHPGRVAVRSLFMVAAMALYFGSLAFLPVSSAAAGVFTAPIFVLLASVVVLRAPVGWRRLLAVAVGFGGVLFVLRPGFGETGLWSLMPMCAGAFYAVSALLTRHWCAEESTSAMLFSLFATFLVIGSAASLVLVTLDLSVPSGAPGFLLRGWGSLGAEAWTWIALQAVGASAAVGLLIRAYQSADTAAVTIFEYWLLIAAAGWGILLRGQALDRAEILGMVMIIAAGAVLALRGTEAEHAARMAQTRLG